MKNGITKKKVGGGLLGLALLFIFFSKTIYTYHLPEVTAVKPSNGKLSKVEVGHGTVQWAETDYIYIPEDGTVGEIHVNEGEYVEVGDTLFSMEYDQEDNAWNLQEIRNNRDKLMAELQDTENKIQLAEYSDAELLNVQQSLVEAEKYFNASRILYDLGSLSAQDLSEAENQVNYLRLKLVNLKAQEQENKDSLQLEAKKIKLELDNLSVSEERYKKIQDIYTNKIVVTASQAGVVISSSILKGQKVQKDLEAMVVGTGNEYDLQCLIALENNFVNTGDTCKLSNFSQQVKGIITSVNPTQEGKVVRIRFTSEDVSAGETFQVLFEKQSETSYVLVPNASVCQDTAGYYLKQLKRRDGIMGKEYYLERVDIYIGDSDDQNTAVIQGITFFEPILLYSNKTAVLGDVVLLKNAGDFFEE